jgi:hypothetical protein
VIEKLHQNGVLLAADFDGDDRLVEMAEIEGFFFDLEKFPKLPSRRPIVFLSPDLPIRGCERRPLHVEGSLPSSSARTASQTHSADPRDESGEAVCRPSVSGHRLEMIAGRSFR